MREKSKLLLKHSRQVFTWVSVAALPGTQMGASMLKFPLSESKIVESNLADIVSYCTCAVAVAQVNT